MDSLAGQLLVSSPILFDPNFRRTVLLMTHHDEEGAMGLVLTRPLEIRVDDAVEELGDLPADDVIYSGGPVQPEVLVVLVEFEEPQDSSPIVGGVSFLPPDLPAETPALRARVFAGYAGWGAGQLEEELAEQSWIVVPAEPDDVFYDDPDELWRAVLRRKGGKFALIATMPLDPRLN
jgi:putative transcriptional regulator